MKKLFLILVIIFSSVLKASPALLQAVLTKQPDQVEKILANGNNDLNICFAGKTLVQHAVRSGNIRSAILLVKHGADFSGNIDPNGNVMDWAITRSGAPQMLNFIEALITSGWNIHNDTHGFAGGYYNNPLLTNVWYKALYTKSSVNLDLLKLFLKNGANPNQKIFITGLCPQIVWTPLLLAVTSGRIEAIELLLDAGADINLKGMPLWFNVEEHSPVSLAAKIGCYPEMVSFLLKRGAKIN